MRFLTQKKSVKLFPEFHYFELKFSIIEDYLLYFFLEHTVRYSHLRKLFFIVVYRWRFFCKFYHCHLHRGLHRPRSIINQISLCCMIIRNVFIDTTVNQTTNKCLNCQFSRLIIFLFSAPKKKMMFTKLLLNKELNDEGNR